MTPQEKPIGYTDTPFIPGQKWRVHDIARPQPPIVTPGAADSNGPPSDAVVLFDGSGLQSWEGKAGAAGWKVEKGYMEVVPQSGNIWTRESFGACQLHLEWTPPAVIESNSQGRGNSGIFLLRKYEIQVLDCYDNPTYADGSTGSVYGQHPPLVNACRKPGEWQAFDIVFEPPSFNRDALKKPAFVTVFLNGLLLHHRVELLGPTQNKRAAAYNEPHPTVAPIELQDHKNPVRFRNIWIRPLDLA